MWCLLTLESKYSNKVYEWKKFFVSWKLSSETYFLCEINGILLLNYEMTSNTRVIINRFHHKQIIILGYRQRATTVKIHIFAFNNYK